MLSPVGKIFLRGIQFIVVPIVFTSLIVGFTSIKNSEKVGRLTWRLVFLYIVTNLVALVIGMSTAAIIKAWKLCNDLGELTSKKRLKVKES